MISFYQYEVVTKIKVKDEVELNFPIVYFCIEKAQLYPFDCQFNSSDQYSYLVEKNYANNKCLVFNSGKTAQGQVTEPLKLKAVGNDFGLKIQFYLEKPGQVKVFTGDHSILPSVNEIGRINQHNGLAIHIILTKVSVKNLPYPHNNCHDNLNNPIAFNSDLYRLTLNNSYKYRQENCFDICTCQALSKKCNCTCPGIFETSSESNCYDNACFKEKLRNYDRTKICSEFCPRECNSVFFQSTLNSFVYLQTKSNSDQQKFDEYAKENGLPFDINDKRIAVYLYLYDMKSTDISQVAKMTGADLVSSIGGCFGLFMGLSLLSLIEILDFFVEVGYLIGEKYTLKRRVESF